MAESDFPVDIFNSRYFGRVHSPAPCGNSEFSLFARLPRELRLQIWTCHLPRRRFLRVLLEENSEAQHGEEPEHQVSDDDDEWTPIFAAGSEKPDTLASSSATKPLLRVTFLGDPSPTMPALRQVCREAREAHNSIYRIRFPALTRIPRGYDYTTKRVVAPEIVTLNLMPLFLHHLVQHDFSPGPLRFGVRHLCVDLRLLSNDYHHGADEERVLDSLAPEVLASVRRTVSNLRGLYLHLTTASHLEPRVMSGPFINTRSYPWYNASVPVLPSTSWGFAGAVEPVPNGDPRLALPEGKADLRQVWVGDQLRPSLDVWAGLERAWGIPAGSNRNRVVRALVGLDTEDWAGRISSLGAYLREEGAAWESLINPTSEMGALLRDYFQGAHQWILPRDPGPPCLMAPVEWMLQRQTATAVGFWLVDPEFLEAAETKGVTGKQIVNLSKNFRPEDIELWVFRGA